MEHTNTLDDDDWAINWDIFLPPSNFEHDEGAAASAPAGADPSSSQITHSSVSIISSIMLPGDQSNRLIQHYLEVCGRFL